ncbi:MAG: FAD-binding oxidoreductase [Chloroflexota bacterium]
MNSTTAIIIGGGVIGLSTAYHLARKQFGRIILIEKNHIGAGASSRAGGIITSLLWGEAGVRARQISLDLYHELSDELPGYTFHDVGCLNLFDPPSWPEREQLLPLYDRLQASYEILSAAEMHARWPALHPADELIGLHDPLGGYSEPEFYVPALAQRVRDLGVEIYEETQVTSLVEWNGRIAGVTITDTANVDGKNTIEGDVVICTTHVWSNILLKRFDIQMPMKAFVHQRYVTMPLPAPVDTTVNSPVNIPAVNANPHDGYIRPESGNRLLAGIETALREEHRVGSLDFQMPTLTVPDSLQDELATNLTPLVPALAQMHWDTKKVGLICFSIDGEPILGPVTQLPGLLLGCAFHSGGFAYNPVAGLLLAQLAVDGNTEIDISTFSPNRFDTAVSADYLASTIPQAHAVQRRH